MLHSPQPDRFALSPDRRPECSSFFAIRSPRDALAQVSGHLIGKHSLQFSPDFGDRHSRTTAEGDEGCAGSVELGPAHPKGNIRRKRVVSCLEMSQSTRQHVGLPRIERLADHLELGEAVSNPLSCDGACSRDRFPCDCHAETLASPSLPSKRLAEAYNGIGDRFFTAVTPSIPRTHSNEKQPCRPGGPGALLEEALPYATAHACNG